MTTKQPALKCTLMMIVIEFSYSLVTTSEIDQKVAGLKAGVKAGGRKNRQVKNSIWVEVG